jgi:hypothetical protein
VSGAGEVDFGGDVVVVGLIRFTLSGFVLVLLLFTARRIAYRNQAYLSRVGIKASGKYTNPNKYTSYSKEEYRNE